MRCAAVRAFWVLMVKRSGLMGSDSCVEENLSLSLVDLTSLDYPGRGGTGGSGGSGPGLSGAGSSGGGCCGGGVGSLVAAGGFGAGCGRLPSGFAADAISLQAARCSAGEGS